MMITSPEGKAVGAPSFIPPGCQTLHPSRGREVPGF